jgi:basic amino acid/polyamine antiporter, APA family
VLAGLLHATPEPLAFAPSPRALGELGSPGFAVSLIYVSYAYSGWNAAGYMAGELAQPQRVFPRALVAGTLVVTALYLALNWTFLRSVPLERLAGVVEVGALSATELFGASGGRIMSGLIALLLTATVSAMVLAGSRVTEAVSHDLPSLSSVGVRSASGVPRKAILLQAGLTLLLVLTNSVEQVMTYTGFTLNLATLATVLGVWVLRRREPQLPRPYRTWGYPATPLFFVVASTWTLAFVLTERPAASLAGLATLLLGSGVYALDRRR